MNEHHLYSDESGYIFEHNEQDTRTWALAWMHDPEDIHMNQPPGPLPEVRVYLLGWDSRDVPRNWVLS
jgi:hypothetical protein